MKKKTSTRSFKKLDMPDAAAFIYSMGIKTYNEYIKLSKDGLRPAFLPFTLNSYYPDYPGWDEFLKLGQEMSKSSEQAETNTAHFFIDYFELKHIVKIKRITSASGYQKARRNNELPAGAPPHPDSFYPEFEGWDEFLSDIKFEYLYSQAKELIHPYKLKSSYQWRNFCRDGLKPDGIPVLPDRDYPDFVSWADFLGYEEKKG